jgi:hypothetical protein
VPPDLPVKEASLSDLKEQIRSVSRVKAQAEALRARAAAEFAKRAGDSLAEKTLREQSGQSTRGTRAELETANKLQDLPTTAEALDEGEITSGHARIIAKAAEGVNIDEEELVGKAKREPVDVFAHTARRHAQQQSADDGMSVLQQQRRQRRGWIRTDRGSGMIILHAEFDPIRGAQIKSALSKKTDDLWRDEDPNTRPTTAQRMADALAELLCRPASKNGKRVETTVVLVAQYDVINRQLHEATLGDGTPIPIEAFKDLACQAKILPAIFDRKGQALWVGMGRRIANYAQRMALIARDRGCVGCGADPAWCQAHHIIPWAADGPTDIENLCLLCSKCHHRVHDEQWEITQTPQGQHVLQTPFRNNRRALPIKNDPTPAGGRRKPTTRLLL